MNTPLSENESSVEASTSTQPSIVNSYNPVPFSPLLEPAQFSELYDVAQNTQDERLGLACTNNESAAPPFVRMLTRLKTSGLEELISALKANGSLMNVLKISRVGALIRSKFRNSSFLKKYAPFRENKAFRELAVETIQQILGYLENVKDFGAARMVSRSWYYSSTTEKLLLSRIKISGWTLDETIDKHPSDPGFLGQLSKRLQMEADLSPSWKRQPALPLLDVTDVSNPSSTSSKTCNRSKTTRLAVSNCQRYLMIFEGYYIYVFRLLAGHIALQWSIMCPRRALSASMDTTYDRMAIAVLLEGRMGIVFDLVNGRLTSIYRNLGVEDDHPISVAIGPQRRCVAFGCRTGIELHWVDVHSCQNQNRWFPLSAPSHYLYFLPAREGIDPVRKLRLISSAGLPSFRTSQSSESSNNSSSPASVTSIRALFWGSTESRIQNDHYQAVPISDGTFVLFTDPMTRKLCLGSDAPLGEPFKLVRKVMFVGPDVPGDNGLPKVYASAPDLRRGLRVVCGYGEDLWLFTVPPDVLDEIYPLKMTTITQGERRRIDCPHRIKGRYIGSIPKLVAVSISTEDTSKHGSLYIRGLSSDGKVYTYGAPSVSFIGTVKRTIGRDGSLQVSANNGCPGSSSSIYGCEHLLTDGPPREWQLNGLAEYLNGTMMVPNGATLYTYPGTGRWRVQDEINLERFINSSSTDGSSDEDINVNGKYLRSKLYAPLRVPHRLAIEDDYLAVSVAIQPNVLVAYLSIPKFTECR